MESEAKKLHIKAEKARETEDFSSSLSLTDEATLAYQTENNLLGLAEVQSSRALTFRHLAEQSGDDNYLILAKHAAMSSVEIALKSGDKKSLAIPYLTLGKALESLGETAQAVEAYREAVAYMTTNPPPDHNRSSVMNEMLVHLSIAEYKVGDKSALVRAEKALADLAMADEPDKYAKDVWVSGGYMGIAEMLKTDDPDKASLSLQRAREIIEANPALTLRKKQLEKLAAKL